MGRTAHTLRRGVDHGGLQVGNLGAFGEWVYDDLTDSSPSSRTVSAIATATSTAV
jgi:hypothetical protein